MYNISSKEKNVIILHFENQTVQEAKMQDNASVSPEYSVLFNRVTDAIEKLEFLLRELKSAQQQAEEAYISVREREIESVQHSASVLA